MGGGKGVLTFDQYYEKYLKRIDNVNRYSTGKIIPLLPEEAIHLFFGQLVIREHDDKMAMDDWRSRNFWKKGSER